MPHPANFIITHARVFTADPANPHAEAVAVSGERITFVGTAADAENWRGPRTRLIDAGGRTLMPGFIDSTFNPMPGVSAALNRQPWAPGLPDHRQTLADTLIAYTRDAAYAEFQENVKGQLRPGLLADMVLLSDDIFTVPVEAIDQVHPVMTLCGGRVVYEA